MNDLFTQFLQNNELNDIWFRRISYDDNLKMDVPEKILGIRFDDIVVALSPAVKNAKMLLLEIAKSGVEADKNYNKFMKIYRNAGLKLEEAYDLCDSLYQYVLPHLIWPCQYLTEEGQLTLEEFLPICKEMENMLDEFCGNLDAFIFAVSQSEDQIAAIVQNRKDDLDRQTRIWAENAPLRLTARGSIKEGFFGPYIELYGEIRSTVTSGQINASYMTNNIVANLGIENKRKELQAGMMEILDKNIKEIIKSFSYRWKKLMGNKDVKLRSIYQRYFFLK